MVTLPGTAESYWMASTEATSYPQLQGDLTVEVAVIGGGIAGLSTAWELAEAGRSVALLEADRIAAGVTGYTTAKLSSLHTLIYADLRKAFGADAARQYARSQQEAIEHVATVASRLEIECELEPVPAFVYAESPRHVQRIRAEVDAAAEAGLPASFVTETGLPFPVPGAIRVADQAQFHPRKYLLGLAADLARRGRIFEHSRAVKLHEGQPCRVTLENGSTVTATDVVVATHYPVFDRALLFGRLSPRRELVVAATIPADRDPGGIYLTPEHNTRSVRTAPYRDGQRLLIVTGEHFTPGAKHVTQRWQRLVDWTRQHFPDAQLAYRWAAQDNGTTDHLPHIGPFHPGARHTYVATGFGGWGMSTGVLAGRLLTELITGTGSPWAKLYDPRRLHPVREAAPLLKLQAKVAGHFVGDRLRRSRTDTVDTIAAGTGAVVRTDGEQHAVYRDDAGALHAVSARCTHLGCIVHFNDAERTWDCPCHGSRFATDGTVIQGPANRPLEQHKLD